MRNTPKNRRHPRANTTATVQLWKRREPTPVRAQDISASGVFLRTEDNIRPGSYVTVKVAIPGLAPFTALCRVARTTKATLLGRAGLGLEFLDLSPARKALIGDYVAQRSMEHAVEAQAAA